MAIVDRYSLEPLVGDPDDHRPDSNWALVTDPGDSAGTADMAVIYEEIAPGDMIPLHRHPIDEVVLVVEGTLEATLGTETKTVGSGATAFVPRLTPHRWRNTGSVSARISAIFPSTIVGMQMLERNPAPGAESKEPSTVEYNLRTGDFREIDASKWT